jgi:hypothetical protein
VPDASAAESSKTDENGKAVHEECYLLTLRLKQATTPAPKISQRIVGTLNVVQEPKITRAEHPDEEWETVVMAKRNLRVVKWLGTVPAIGVCTLCNREFKVPMTAMKRVADAQESLRIQFAEHKCKREDTSQAAKN